MVMDHFYQLPARLALRCLHARVLRPALSSRSRDINDSSSLVTGNTYRNPAVLARRSTRHRVWSCQLGIEQGGLSRTLSFGIEFGTFTDRFEKLDEAWSHPPLNGERPTLDGKWYQVVDDEPATASEENPCDDRRRWREEEPEVRCPICRRLKPHLRSR